MLRVAAAPRLSPLVHAQGEHPGVLAGAVAVDGPRFLAAARELRRGVERRVHAVLEVSFAESGLPEDGTDGGEVRFLGVVRSAGDGELLVRESQRVRGAG